MVWMLHLLAMLSELSIHGKGSEMSKKDKVQLYYALPMVYMAKEILMLYYTFIFVLNSMADV